MQKNDFWNTYFMKRVKVKATGETGTIIDFTSIKDVFIVEMDYPKKEDVYHIRDYDLEDLIIFDDLPDECRELLKDSPYIINGNFESPGYNIEPYHNIGACYWIMPVKIKDMSKESSNLDNQDILAEEEISIDQAVFEELLLPTLKRHFDNDLPENVARGEEYSPVRYNDGIAFDWDLSNNFYTFEQMEKILADIKELVASHKDNYNELELDFFEQFDSRIRKMMKAGAEKGYKILSVGSP